MARSSILTPRARHRRWTLRSLATAVAAALIALSGSAALAQEGPFDHLQLELVAEGLTSPVNLVSPPGDDRLFVVDQVGLIHIIDADGNLLPEPFLDARPHLMTFRPGFDERGLLSIAFHPNYERNGRFFVYYNAPLRAGSLAALNNTMTISEFRVSATDPNRADPFSQRRVLEIDDPAFNHNGGQLAFGPDGYLYIAIGDGGQSNDQGPFHPPMGNGQDITTLLGAILRIDVNDDDGRGYAVPADNPFVGGVELANDAEAGIVWSGLASGQGARDEIYVWGLRNPFRFSFDTETGDLWIGDVGQGMYEEHTRVTAPGNLGWRIREAESCFNREVAREPLDECADVGPRGEPLVPPTFFYEHAGGFPETGLGISTTGGFVYRGSAIPGLVGAYVFGDWSNSFQAASGKLFVATEGADGWEIVLDRAMELFVLALGQDGAGELYLLTTENSAPTGETGRVWRIVAGE